MKALNIALAAALLASGGAASAQSSTDIQCLVVANAFAGQAKDANAQKVAEAAVFFYLGRIGNLTPAQLKTQLDAQTKTLNNQNAGPTMQRCAAGVQTKVQLLQGAAPAAAAKPAAAAAKPSPTGR
jgi:hypothetical protein